MKMYGILCLIAAVFYIVVAILIDQEYLQPLDVKDLTVYGILLGAAMLCFVSITAIERNEDGDKNKD